MQKCCIKKLFEMKLDKMHTSLRLFMNFITCRVDKNSGNFEKNSYHQYTVEIYRFFHRLVFNGCQFCIFIDIQIRKFSIGIQQERLVVIKGVFVQGRDLSAIDFHTIFRRATVF